MKKLAHLLAASIAASLVVSAQVPGPAGGFTLEQVLSYPFPDNLIASPKGSLLAWTFNERGVRNIFVAEGPDFQARRLTPYQHDDGQELTGLAFAPDGRTLVYVRGGDHGSNWNAEGNLQPNPGSSTVQPRMQVWSIATAGPAAPRLLGEGDTPAIAPAGDRAGRRSRRLRQGPPHLDRAARRIEAG
jgi:hypothetical protein